MRPVRMPMSVFTRPDGVATVPPLMMKSNASAMVLVPFPGGRHFPSLTN